MNPGYRVTCGRLLFLGDLCAKLVSSFPTMLIWKIVREQQAITTAHQEPREKKPGLEGDGHTIALFLPRGLGGGSTIRSLGIRRNTCPFDPFDLGGCPIRWLAYTLAASCVEKQWGEGEDREGQSLEVFPSSFWLSYWHQMSWFQALSIRPCAPHSFFFSKFVILTNVLWHQWPARRIICVISKVSAQTNYNHVNA